MTPGRTRATDRSPQAHRRATVLEPSWSSARAAAWVAVSPPCSPTPDHRSPRIPVGRLGRPEEVAALAIAVLTNDYLTNQVVSLDGGMHPR